MQSDKHEEFQALMNSLSENETRILKEILQAEKSLIHRENLQGTNIVSQIIEIIKERVGE